MWLNPEKAVVIYYAVNLHWIYKLFSDFFAHRSGDYCFRKKILQKLVSSTHLGCSLPWQLLFLGLMFKIIVPSGKSKPSATPNKSFFGAQSLQLALTAYNVSCLRLTCYIAGTRPRLDTKCAGSALSRRLFQPRVQWCFRGAPTLWKIPTAESPRRRPRGPFTELCCGINPAN